MLITLAHHRFLLAELHISSLAREDSKRGLFRALKNLPTEINDTYERTLLRIDSSESQKAKRANEVLMWITHAQRPLTVSELCHALSVEPADTTFDRDGLPNFPNLLSACCGLVIIDQTDTTIRLVHHTAKQCFDRVKHSKYPSAHNIMATTCLTYLSFDDFSKDLFLEDGNDNEFNRVSRPPFLERYNKSVILEARKRNFALLHYAAVHWGIHARLGCEQQVCTAIKHFFNRSANVSQSTQLWDRKYALPGMFRDPRDWLLPQKCSGLHILAYFGLVWTASHNYGNTEEVYARDADGSTPLHWAALHGRTTMIEHVLQWGARIDAKNRYGITSLEMAASAGHASSVRLLLDNSADPIGQNASMSPFASAVERGNEEVIKVFLSQQQWKFDIQKGLWQILRGAVQYGNQRILRLLLQESNTLGDAKRGKLSSLLSLVGGNADYAELIKLLIQEGADVNHLSVRPRDEMKTCIEKMVSCIHLASTIEHTSILLAHGASINAFDSEGETPLHYQLRQNMPDDNTKATVTWFLDHGAQINIQSRKGKTPIMLAAKRRSHDLVALLPDRNADISLRNMKGLLAMDYAARNGDVGMTKLLVLPDWSPATQEFYTQVTKLHRQLDIHRRRSGLNPGETFKDEPGASSASIKVITDLVHGIDDHSWRTNTHLMPLGKAVRNGLVAEVQHLVDLGADVLKIDHYTMSSAYHYPGQEELMKCLFQAGGSTVRYKNMAFTVAMKEGRLGMAKLILDCGADIEGLNDKGETSLLVAASRGDSMMIQFLLSHGADVNAVCRHGYGVLHIQVTGLTSRDGKRREECIRLLLQAGANIEAKLTTGHTPLALAALVGNIGCIKCLLANGADPSKVDLPPEPEKNLPGKQKKNMVYEEDYYEALRMIDEAKRKQKSANTA